MRFMEMKNLLRTNALFARLEPIDPNDTIEIEAYSCKQTKKERKCYTMPKPLRFYVSVLEMTYPDYDFSKFSYKSFIKTTIEHVKKEISFIFLTIYKNNDDVTEFISFYECIINQVICLKNCIIMLVDIEIDSEYLYQKTFLFYNKKLKRILVLKLSSQKSVNKSL